MFLHPQPGRNFQAALYNHPTYFQGTDDMYGLLVDEEKSKEIGKMRVQEILEKNNLRESILEIGCGYGHTLLEAKKAGFKKADGIELSEEAVKSCIEKDLNVQKGFIENIFRDFKPYKYDVVALYSTLEHFEDPSKFLSEVKAFLHNDSLLIMRVPNEPKEGPWLSLVDHLWHFNEDSIKNLMSKNGFAVSKIFPSGSFQGIQHEGKLRSMTVIAKLK